MLCLPCQPLPLFSVPPTAPEPTDPPHPPPQHRADTNAAEVQRVLTAGGRFVVTQPGGAPRVVGTTGAARFKASMVTR
jgi:hypothetical protein